MDYSDFYWGASHMDGETVRVSLDVSSLPELLANAKINVVVQKEVSLLLKQLAQCIGLVSVSFAFAGLGVGAYYFRSAFRIGSRPTVGSDRRK